MMIFTNLTREFKSFYQFLTIHTILVGLFQVLLPSYLWSNGIGIVKLSLFISVTAVGFVVSLFIWELIYHKYSFSKIIIISFVVQIIFMTLVFKHNNNLSLFFLAILNGSYNCFFWITQRAMFFETISTVNSGRKFGNFQIFVAVLLNIGIVVSAVMLDKYGFFGVYISTVLISVLAVLFYISNKKDISINYFNSRPLKIREILTFKDKFGSRIVFFIDGLFLFLESYFWIISLFIISRESFLTLSFLIVSIAVLLAIVFYFIKSVIDKIAKKTIYVTGVFLYALSWIFRTHIGDNHELLYTFLLLIGITFATAFFRLAFNKRFFDIAKKTNKHNYLLIKSYQSQFFIVIFFLVIAYLAILAPDFNIVLTNSYFIAAILSSFYLLYKEPKSTS